MDLLVPDRSPFTAAMLTEVLQRRDHGDAAAMTAYERKYGVLAEGALTGWEDSDCAAEITEEDFEQIWSAARRRLDSADSSTEYEGAS